MAIKTLGLEAITIYCFSYIFLKLVDDPLLYRNNGQGAVYENEHLMIRLLKHLLMI